MLSIESAKSGYGASQVLFGVDLRIGAGQVVTLLGRNGMGKTTLLRTLFGQLPLRGGAIRFAGQDISGWSPDRIARLGMAIVPEGRQCFPNLTVREHLTALSRRAIRTSARPGRPSGCSSCFPAWANAPATWATSCPAANSRCWPSAGRWSPIRAC